MLKVIKLLIIFVVIFQFNFLYSNSSYSSTAFITNQESNKLDIIDLKTRKKIDEIEIGGNPAGIALNNKENIIYTTNPESNDITEFNFSNGNIKKLNSGKSPLGLYYSSSGKLVVSNWYSNQITIINTKKKKNIKKIKVGKSPAGVYLSENEKLIFVANREDNNVTVLNSDSLKFVKNITVGNAPFGIFSNNEIDFLVVTNVQSNSISLINKVSLKVIETINVGKWPYYAAYDKRKRNLYITNQRSDSISVIDVNTFSKIKTINDICEYPEGIDISYNENLLVVACWFEDNIILLDLDSLEKIKKIKTSGGPRAFGNFILEKNEN